MVADAVVDDTEVDVGQEFASNIGNFLMLRVKLNGVIVALGVGLSHLHAVDTNTVVGESLSVDVSNSATHLQEFFVLLDS